MNSEIAQKILTVATYPMSATSIAMKVGKSKGCQIEEEIQYLVRNSSLEMNSDGRFPTYKVTPNSVSVTTQRNVKSEVISDTTTEMDASDLPAGFSIQKNARGAVQKVKRGNDVGTNITTPTGQKYFVKEGSALVVINGEAICTVKSPTSSIGVIAKYAEEHGYTSYTVSQTNVGTVSAGSIKNMSGVIDVKISKNNKAA